MLLKKKYIIGILALCLLNLASAEIIWDYPDHFICDSPVHCYIKGNITQYGYGDVIVKTDNIRATDPYTHKIKKSEAKKEEIVKVEEDVFGYVEKTYKCNNKIKDSTDKKRKICVDQLTNGTKEIILFDKEYKHYDDNTKEFIYDEYGKIGKKYVNKVKYKSGEFILHEGKPYEFRYDITVSPSSSGKADLEFCFFDEGKKVCDTLDPFWNTQWGYYREFNISNPNTYDLINFQVNAEFDLSVIKAHAKDDCTDIRFVVQDDGEWNKTLNYFIDEEEGIGSGCNIDGNTNFTLNITLPAKSNTTVRMYYNNSDATNVSNPYNVFLLYDNFNDNSLNTTLWETFSTSYTEENGYLQLEGGTVGARAINSKINWTWNKTLEWRSGYDNSGTDSCIVGFTDEYSGSRPGTNGNYSISWYASSPEYAGEEQLYNSPTTYVSFAPWRDGYVWYEYLLNWTDNVTGKYSIKDYEGNYAEANDDSGIKQPTKLNVILSKRDSGTYLRVDWVRVRYWAVREITHTALGNEQLVSLLPLSWNWTDINSTITHDSTTICVNALESVNCTLYFDGTAYPNTTIGTNICWNVKLDYGINYTTINATCEDAISNKNTTTNAWVMYLPEQTNLTYYCPSLVFVGDPFTIWADYTYTNGTTIKDADVSISNSTITYPLNYNAGYDDYRNDFIESDDEYIWNITITASKTGFEEKTANCSIDIQNSFNLTIYLWEEVDKEILANTSEWVITRKNYDKQLIDPYINDFGYIIARNNDKNATGAYTYCNFPFGSAQTILSIINIGNWMGDRLTNMTTHYTGEYIGCDKYWFRSKYLNGKASLELPYTGNYSLYFVDGVIEWENEVSPPKIVHSNLFLYLGEIRIPAKANYEQNFWISHDELDWWGTITDNVFVYMVILLPFLIAILLYLAGFGLKSITLIVIVWEIAWTLIKMLS